MKEQQKDESIFIFLIVWLFFYLMVKYFFKKNLFLIGVYCVFVIAMYFFDVKLKKWGLINKINRHNPDSSFSSGRLNVISTFASISIALLTFTAGYIIKKAHLNRDLSFSVVSIFFSSVCFLITLEAKDTDITLNYEKKKKGRLFYISRWTYIAGWHLLFIYALLIINLISEIIFLISLYFYTIILWHYYFSLDLYDNGENYGD